MTALALRDDQTYWDEGQLAVLQSGGIDEGVTRAELTAFLHECQRRRLDPFTRQIYLIGRWDNQKRRKVYRSQTSIDGFRLIARRAADEAKESIEYEDAIWYGSDGGQHEIWLEEGPPAGCKIVVLRDGKRFPVVARFSSYVQLNNDGAMVGLWRKMPDGQIAKCAEALALRKAFPEELGGIYTEEEMAQADNPQPVRAEVIRDEPGQQQPAGANGGQGSADEKWLADALAKAATFGTDEDGRALWVEGGNRQRDGRITAKQAGELAALIKARGEEIGQRAAQDAQPVDGVVMVVLEPDDEWADKVSDLTDADEATAAEAEVFEECKAGRMPEARADRITAAIRSKAATFGQRVAA